MEESGYAGSTDAEGQASPDVHNVGTGHGSEKLNAKDAEALESRRRQVLEWWYQVREAQAPNRLEMAIDHDFYEGEQITPEERSVLLARKQPPIVMNLIKSAIDWITGTEKRTRVDGKVYPRKDSEEDTEGAINKTKLLKYVSDVNKTPFSRSRAFKDAVIGGVGWIDVGVRGDDDYDPIFTRHESWRHVWYDHHSTEMDPNIDSRFIFRDKTIDLDVALAMWPHRENELRASTRRNSNMLGDEDEFMLPQVYRDYDALGYPVKRASVNQSGNVNNRRERVRIVRCEYKEPLAVKRIKEQPGSETALNGELFDENNPEHMQGRDEQVFAVVQAVEMQMRMMFFVEEYVLDDMKSPYKHNKFTLIPVWAFRRDRDGAPFGVVRNMRDAQRDYNTRRSKALHILATRQIIAEADAVEDWDEVERAAADPAGIIKLKAGAAIQNKRFELSKNNDLAEEHVMLMTQDSDYLMRSSGVTDENLGQDTNAASGRAIVAKQNQGSVVTFDLFDNLRFSVQMTGEIKTSLIEQWYDMPKQVRILGENAKHEFVKINMPEYDPMSGQVVVRNDITATKGDYIVDTADFRQSVRQAQFEAMMDLISRLPAEVSIQMLDLAIEMSDMSNKEEWMRRIRKINGQRDADDKLSPEEQEAQMAEAVKAQEAEDRAKRRDDLEMAELELRGKKLRADTARTNVDAIQDASEAAATMAAMPAVAPITDALLESSGFEDERDVGSIRIPAPAPVVDPQAQLQAREFRQPAPRLDPNKVQPEPKTDEKVSSATPAPTRRNTEEAGQ